MPALGYLRTLCETIPRLEVVKVFDQPQRLIDALPQLDFNCCILDIQMPDVSGLELADLLKGKLIIFTTAYKEFAAEAFDLNAVDYLRKPIQRERFEQAVGKALRLLDTRVSQPPLVLASDRGRTPVDISQIAYIVNSDTDRRDKILHLLNGQRLTLKNISFEQLNALLPTSNFCRINKSELIALSIVEHFSAAEIHCSLPGHGGRSLRFVLSEAYRDVFFSRIQS